MNPLVAETICSQISEFNSSGYDSSDKVDQPSHPVIFTKRATSIIAHGEPIFPHHGFTESLDYEGEIGVIIGRSGFKIEEADAMNYVWGYTIINDMTARERQRDHKQFYIGKSSDTFCPMGPIAVPKTKLPEVLQIQTHVNGEKRQDATIKDLIFSVPFLIKTLSEGTTIQPGDVIATGTPAGVGIGMKPNVFLKPGDVVDVSVTGLGTLSNTISFKDSNYISERVAKVTYVPISNDKTSGGAGLTYLNNKKLYYKNTGIESGSPIIFIHGLGGSKESFTPLISELSLAEKYSLHLSDLEGHGLSPTSATSVISISSYADDIKAIVDFAKAKSATVIAHSLGCLVALTLATRYPNLFEKLILLGPPPSPLPATSRFGSTARAATVRANGVVSVVDAVVDAGTSAKTKYANPLAVAAVRISLLGQDPEGYAKGCTALAGATETIPVENIKIQTLIITGDEDKVSPPDLCDKYVSQLPNAKLEILENVGHWHVFEDPVAVSAAIKSFL
jgi:2-keto-4-pentenoate hydratase/2-oxohepta-3-ene-1,7-dioic acid hydratase in catechol pathway/pimeloyl-ACP methyl ester carboxylesterase